MILDVVIWEIVGHKRSQAVCRAMLEGIQKVGDRVTILAHNRYRHPEGHVGVFYGLAGGLAQALVDYPKAGRSAIYADMGYWRRKDLGRFDGYHKLVLNARHPTAYFQAKKHKPDRLKALDVHVLPWRQGDQVVVCGMGPKGAAAERMRPNEWERGIIEAIQQRTARPIVYRPKPIWVTALSIPGTIWGPQDQTLEACLANAHSVVSHHSNANVEGLMMGVASVTTAGAALPLSLTEFDDTPRRPPDLDRIQWAADLAYTQWSIAEMREGRAWRHLKDEGLVP